MDLASVAVATVIVGLIAGIAKALHYGVKSGLLIRGARREDRARLRRDVILPTIEELNSLPRHVTAQAQLTTWPRARNVHADLVKRLPEPLTALLDTVAGALRELRAQEPKVLALANQKLVALADEWLDKTDLPYPGTCEIFIRGTPHAGRPADEETVNIGHLFISGASLREWAVERLGVPGEQAYAGVRIGGREVGRTTEAEKWCEIVIAQLTADNRAFAAKKLAFLATELRPRLSGMLQEEMRRNS